MPTLEWIGKNKVVNHHLEVPYQVLQRVYSYDEKGQHPEDNGSENKIIHGDNLAALKSLLPQYEGKIKCIYIDPPYNTGNEGWVYNDNVNDPRIQKWLGEVVGKEGEDLSRHDKWLCMMYPRLRLLQRLLSEDGAIFISIDDNEQAHLKEICDEIFGIQCFVASISWQHTYSPRNDSKGISGETEYILVYSKKIGWTPHKLPRTKKMNSKYQNKDGDKELWRTSDAFAPSAATHQGMVYAIQHPFTGDMIYPYNGACWPWQQDDMLNVMQNWAAYKYENLHDEDRRAEVCGISVNKIKKDVKGIILAEPLSEAKKHAKMVYDKGCWPLFFFTSNGLGGIARKTYLKDTEGRVVTNFWSYDETGHTDEAKKEIKTIFGKKVFDTPKPTRLLKRIIQIATNKDSIVLDAFAGSGTTAHSVLETNLEDNGNRKFILVEMMDYANDITAQRVKKVISGYSKEKNKENVLMEEKITLKVLEKGKELIEQALKIKKEAKNAYDNVSIKIIDNHLQVIGTIKATDEIKGIGGSFSYYELGQPIFHGDFLNEEIGLEEIRKYVYFTETRQPAEPIRPEEPAYLGKWMDTVYYFHYDRNAATTLNWDFLAKVRTKGESYVMYADRCTLSEEELQKYHITFKKIPRDIARF
ncbi:site-specific DNA-methyltransferase [Acidaminococcus fermentans DSM 20731]|uniref:Site-specific DNA-methyltransferase (Adenine-specific) n=1 Tax=Acidaminococcus fermentans (strain ATCC 25085 / DSM 20731 / CCUG 9996 / CIP 106432 / VR4) TaxID=591001 RepID=D2RKH4_ACIFV|nr:site-specific DNA-methyltransferase [Acidaminococcus fermentans]ADB47576.1 Site-specific DNA-methyltransferase (adenine- specific) [Acidaminococcus fermentans DSM 20731]UEA71805.1 site-specific DNA-methyltransferase [Acidaminococcus fermentans DSM 20731]